MSTKSADYLVTGKRYNENRSRIAAVEVRSKSKNLHDAEIWSSQKVIDEIEKHQKTFVTSPNVLGIPLRVEDVRVMQVNGIKYLRTDSNSIASDNLSNLPEV